MGETGTIHIWQRETQVKSDRVIMGNVTTPKWDKRQKVGEIRVKLRGERLERELLSSWEKVYLRATRRDKKQEERSGKETRSGRRQEVGGDKK